MSRNRRVIGGLVAATALLLSGCAGGEVSAAAVQQSVRDGLAGQGVEARSVSCPTGVDSRVGSVVVCAVDLWDEEALGQPVDRVRVEVTEVDGDQVRYRLVPLAVGVPDDAQPGDEPGDEQPTPPPDDDSTTTDPPDDDSSTTTD